MTVLREAGDEVVARARFHTVERRMYEMRYFAGPCKHAMLRTPDGFRMDQVRRAMLGVQEHGAGFKIDPRRIHLGGFSAGAHLTAMVLSGAPGVVRGALAASGLYDLEPLRHGEANGWLQLDEPMARRNSPLHNVSGQGCPLILVHAASDTAEFRRQGCEFAAAWVTAGHPLRFWEMAEHNHFDNILELADTESRLFKALMDQISQA